MCSRSSQRFLAVEFKPFSGGVPAADRRMQKPSWPGLDGLRAFAVVAVVVFHAGYAPRGFLGIDVFFVLSGFLITSLLLHEAAVNGRIALLPFYARRVLRLYPALVATSAFCVAVAVITSRAVGANLHDAAASMFYIANLVHLRGGLLDHAWTLALEEQFYLTWPLLLLLALRWRSRWAYAPALLLLVGVLAGDLASGRGGSLHTYVRAMGLPLGCALAFVGIRRQRQFGVFALPAGCALLVLAVSHAPMWLVAGWPISAGAVLAVPVIAALVTREIPLMKHPLLLWIGRRSYGMYLWHFPILSLSINHAPNAVPHIGRAVAGATVTVVTTAVSYRLVEKPFLRRKERLRPTPDAARGQRPAASPIGLSGRPGSTA